METIVNHAFFLNGGSLEITSRLQCIKKKKLPDKPYLNVCVRRPKDTDHIRDLIHAVHQVAVELQKYM